jgi:hypothetical protein
MAAPVPSGWKNRNFIFQRSGFLLFQLHLSVLRPVGPFCGFLMEH